MPTLKDLTWFVRIVNFTYIFILLFIISQTNSFDKESVQIAFMEKSLRESNLIWEKEITRKHKLMKKKSKEGFNKYDYAVQRRTDEIISLHFAIKNLIEDCRNKILENNKINSIQNIPTHKFDDNFETNRTFIYPNEKKQVILSIQLLKSIKKYQYIKEKLRKFYNLSLYENKLYAEIQKKNWQTNTFKNESLIGVLYTLTQMEFLLLKESNEIIECTNGMVGESCYFIVIKVGAFVGYFNLENSQKVKAKLNLQTPNTTDWELDTISFSEKNGKMSKYKCTDFERLNSWFIPVYEFSFLAESDTFNAYGYVKKNWTIDAKYTGLEYKDTTIHISEDYYVTKPVIKIYKKQADIFYEGCENELIVRAPSLADDYFPSFTAENAEINVIDDKGKIVIVPKGKKTNIKMSNNGINLLDLSYIVAPPPAPEVEILAENIKLDVKNGGLCPKSLQIKFSADPNFQREFPKDALFLPAEWKISLYRRGKNVFSKMAKTAHFDLKSFQEKAKIGDYLIIEVESCFRKNFQNKTFLLNFTTKTFVYPIL